MRWTLGQRSARSCADERYPVDSEGVWSWHPWAGAKSADGKSTDDGDYEVMDTGESALDKL